MINKEEELKSIEKVLLPHGFKFTDEQKNIIFHEDSANIVAGPGSGKTAVLIAKIALIMKHTSSLKDNDSRGVCIITHTNVAVDEIKSKLFQLGIEIIKSPHFIGTIHDFCNTFMLNQAYDKLYEHNSITIFDEQEYKERFVEIYDRDKDKKSKGYAPTSMISNTHLRFSDDGVDDIVEEVKKNKQKLKDTFNELLEAGILRHNDILSLSMWYLEKYTLKVQKAFEARFSWFILDETQDTNLFQYEILQKVYTNTSCKVQKYGDPYQSLYNMFSNTKDAWIPSEEEDNMIIFELSQSNRFGEPIAKVLQTTCIEHYESLRGNSEIASYNPHIIFFRDKENVIPSYLNIINNYTPRDTIFRNSEKMISAVGLFHNEVKSYYGNYNKKNKTSQINNHKVLNFYDLIINKLFYYANRNDSSFSYNQFKNEINEDIKIKTDLSVLICNLSYKKTEYINIELKNIFEKFINQREIDLNVDLLSDTIEGLTLEIEELKKVYEMASQVSDFSNEDQGYTFKDINFGTVHGVKGETHKATLLLESEMTINRYKSNEKKVYDCNLIFDYLMGDFTDYSKEKYGMSMAIKNALKTAFVALSRPTHLAVVAMSIDNFADEDEYEAKVKKAEESGWEVIIA